MDNWDSQPSNTSFSVSLWQGETLLGWYRAKDLYAEGIRLNGALGHLHNNSIVTVLIELKKHGEYTVHPLKALVCQKSDTTELLWVNQDANLPSMIPYIAFPPPGENRVHARKYRSS